MRPYSPMSPERNPIWLRTFSGSRTISYPPRLAVPEVGFSKVAINRKVVVFPAPFGPSKPKISPG